MIIYIYIYIRKYITSGWVEHSASPLGPISLLTEEPEDSLLENMFFTSVIYDFLHQFLTDVESIMVNIGFEKPMLT